MVKNRKLLDMKMVEKGYTYQKLARAVGVSTTTLTNKVNHELDFKLKEAERIADVLDMSQQEFIDIFIRKTFV